MLVNDNVRRLDRASYERAMSGFIDAFGGLPGVVSLYQLGSVRFPGISDLDVIVVVDPSIAPGTDFRQRVHAASGPDGPYLFSHPPYVIHADGFRYLPSLFFADNLQRLWGRELVFDDTPDEEQAFCAFQIAVEAAVAQSFAFLRAMHNRAVPDLRSLLCNLNAVRHNVTTMAALSGTARPGHWADYSAHIDRLRGEWYELDPAIRLSETEALMAAAHDILMEILGELAGLATHKGYVRAEAHGGWLSLLDINLLLRFRRTATATSRRLANPVGFLRRSHGIGAWLQSRPRWRELSNDVSLLELPASLHPLIDSWTEGAVGAVLAARRFGVAGDPADDLTGPAREWVARKADRLNDYLCFVERRRLSGLLLLTPAVWLQRSTSLGNRLKTGWNRLWVGTQIRGR